MNTINESQVRELLLWQQNTEHLYKMYEAITANYILKIKRGTFKEDVALKGILNLVHNYSGLQLTLSRTRRKIGSSQYVDKVSCRKRNSCSNDGRYSI
jgi:hypothetical protein